MRLYQLVCTCSSLPSPLPALYQLSLPTPTSISHQCDSARWCIVPSAAQTGCNTSFWNRGCFKMSLRGCLGPQPLRCGAEVSDYKGNTLSLQWQEKMIKYKAVERKSMCWCVQTGGGNGQRDNKSGSCEVQQRLGRERVKDGGWCWWCGGWSEMVFLCQMVGGVETKMRVPTGDVTPSINKGCSPFWLTGWAFGQLASLALAC